MKRSADRRREKMARKGPRPRINPRPNAEAPAPYLHNKEFEHTGKRDNLKRGGRREEGGKARGGLEHELPRSKPRTKGVFTLTRVRTWNHPACGTWLTATQPVPMSEKWVPE